MPRSTIGLAAGFRLEDGCEFYCGDGLDAADLMQDRTVDLLLTDPPYGISRRYTCETQIPRRLRKNGSDFIMPKGFFGDWDGPIDPKAWTKRVLPKVAGWAVIFCAQAQIGEYCDILNDHKFVAVGPMVWQKTNPVPFNHKYKPKQPSSYSNAEYSGVRGHLRHHQQSVSSLAYYQRPGVALP